MTKQPRHLLHSLTHFALACALRAAAALWRPVAMSHCEARHATPAMREPAMKRCHMRQRRAGVTRLLRVAPRSARDRMCRPGPMRGNMARPNAH